MGGLSRRHFVGGLLPFVPVVVAIALKFALIDNVDRPVMDHFFQVYLRPAWIEFLAVAYVAGLTAAFSRETTPADIWAFFVFPALCFLVCVFLVLGLPKARIESPLLQVYVPFVLASLCLATSGGRIAS